MILTQKLVKFRSDVWKAIAFLLKANPIKNWYSLDVVIFDIRSVGPSLQISQPVDLASTRLDANSTKLSSSLIKNSVSTNQIKRQDYSELVTHFFMILRINNVSKAYSSVD